MAKRDADKKNERIMKFVVLLIWQMALMTIILGIVFPVVFFLTLKAGYIREQTSIANTATTFVRDMIEEKKRIIAFASLSPSYGTDMERAALTVENRGVSERDSPRIRRLLSELRLVFPSFRFFAYLKLPGVQPALLEPFSSQKALTEAQYLKGYAHREWARQTIALNEGWDGNEPFPVYVSNAFLAQPGEIPGVSVSVVVLKPHGLGDERPRYTKDTKPETLGILYGNITLDHLSEFFTTLRFGKTGIVYLVDGEGNLLAHPTLSPGIQSATEDGGVAWSLRSMRDHPPVREALAGRYSSSLIKSPTGRGSVLASSASVPSSPWIIVVEQETSELFAPIRIYVIVVISLIFFAILVSAVTFAYIARETEESERVHRELRVISETDPLTGLLNRRSMLSRMRQFLSDYAETGQSFVIAMFDIDDFKVVNDTYGHVFGDVVLREIAARTVSILRVDDLLFRWGGEEFLVVVRGCDLSRGRGIAEKIRRVVSDSPISNTSISIRVTVTIGLCEYSGGSIDALIIQADEALYEGKRSGKNRVVVGGVEPILSTKGNDA